MRKIFVASVVIFLVSCAAPSSRVNPKEPVQPSWVPFDKVYKQKELPYPIRSHTVLIDDLKLRLNPDTAKNIQLHDRWALISNVSLVGGLASVTGAAFSKGEDNRAMLNIAGYTMIASSFVFHYLIGDAYLDEAIQVHNRNVGRTALKNRIHPTAIGNHTRDSNAFGVGFSIDY